MSPVATQPWVPAKSNIKAFQMTSANNTLQHVLFSWREENASQKFPKAIVHDQGSTIFLSDEIVTCIIECVHAGKVGMKADLLKETKWRQDWVEEFGDALLNLVCHHVMHHVSQVKTEGLGLRILPCAPANHHATFQEWSETNKDVDKSTKRPRSNKKTRGVYKFDFQAGDLATST